jgi:precorrin-2/cobalt-factor-2 C20-methyltransferase
MNTLGTLYGVGVGPGDPELVTLRAVKYLGRAKVIFAACSTKNDYSRSYNAVQPHLAEDAEVVRLGFPMTRDKDELARAWEDNAKRVAETLRNGIDAAFLTLGDPMLYSTFGYLLKALRNTLPEVDVRIAPGITSIQEAAARTQTILAESQGTVAIASGVTDMQRCKALVTTADTTVILKAYRNFDEIRAALQELGRDKDAVFASKLGMPGQTLVTGLDNVDGKPHYLSLVIVPDKKNG